MKSKKSSQILYIFIAIITVGAVVVFGMTLKNSVLGSSHNNSEEAIEIEPAPVVQYSLTGATSSIPVRLKIPSISVDAHIQQVPLTKKGAMGIPSNYTDVGWYKHGPYPGNSGSSVIAGHLDNGLGIGAVFKDLHVLKEGDDVYIEDEAGTTHHFKVMSSKLYDHAASSTLEVFEKTTEPRLNLITCEGTWDKDKKTYLERLVVFTRLVK